MDLIIFLKKKCKPLEVLCLNKIMTLSNFTSPSRVHMNSYAWLAKMVADKMVKNKIKGSIISLNSIYGLLGQDLNIYEKTSMTENMPYTMIKGGLVNLTRQMASYYGRFGVRVNSICSGGLIGHVAGKSGAQEKQFIKNYEKKVPLKRLGNSEEVANVVAFIASDAASYITGSNILVEKLKSKFIHEPKIIELEQAASLRRYFRINSQNKNFIFMDSIKVTKQFDLLVENKLVMIELLFSYFSPYPNLPISHKQNTPRMLGLMCLIILILF